MTRPELYVFAISHYCEKARWTLDCLDVAYDLRHLAPGPHMQLAKQLGAPGSSVPILVSGAQVVQGSSEIIEWAEAAEHEPHLTLRVASNLEDQCRALERRLDEIAGVHVRRYYYSEALVEFPETVRPMFTRDLEPEARRSVEDNWELVRKLMIGAMDLGTEQGDDSRRILEDELDWLDALLADGRRYLVGDHFSRADITAASLLAPIALPKEHPTYGNLEVPPRARADLARWAERPTVSWVREIYRAHRPGAVAD